LKFSAKKVVFLISSGKNQISPFLGRPGKSPSAPLEKILPTPILGVRINDSVRDDDDDIQRQAKLLYCAANKLRGTFDQCSPAVKSTLFCVYCMPMYACQLWSKYTQVSMKRFRVAYNNAYRIIHYIPRNVSVRPHQVSHCVRTFDALLRNNLYRFF